MQPGTSSEDRETPVVYLSKHIDCPDCKEPMMLYGGLWMCGCGYTEDCCE